MTAEYYTKERWPDGAEVMGEHVYTNFFELIKDIVGLEDDGRTIAVYSNEIVDGKPTLTDHTEVVCTWLMGLYTGDPGTYESYPTAFDKAPALLRLHRREKLEEYLFRMWQSDEFTDQQRAS